MTFTSEFELFDEVYALHDSSIVKFSVRKIEFPTITKWNQDSKYILYGLLPSRELYIYDTMAESENYYITRSEDQLGKTVNELLEKWSEEDEVKINRIVACLENLNVADNDILLKDVAWLKSLRPQTTWKPSDEQMEALKQAKTDACGKPYFNALASLYVNLKGY